MAKSSYTNIKQTVLKMKKHIALLAVLAFMVSLLSSCSPYTLVNSETYNNADLASYKTFRIVTPDQDKKLPPGMQMVTYYNIAAAIREQMVDRGFTEDAASPLLINIGLTTHREIETEPLLPPGYVNPPLMAPYSNFYPYYMYPRWNYFPPSYYNNAQVITGIYKEGVLTMDFINVPEKLALYSASVATIINPGTGQFRNLSSIAEAVNTLFSKFPVPLLPQYKSNH